MPSPEDFGFRRAGWLDNSYTYATPDGQSVTAPVPCWLHAIFETLSEPQRLAVARRVDQMMRNEYVTCDTDGDLLRIVKGA